MSVCLSVCSCLFLSVSSSLSSSPWLSKAYSAQHMPIVISELLYFNCVTKCHRSIKAQKYSAVSPFQQYALFSHPLDDQLGRIYWGFAAQGFY